MIFFVVLYKVCVSTITETKGLNNENCGFPIKIIKDIKQW